MTETKHVTEQLKRAAELARLQRELNYARNMSCHDWSYATIARCLEGDIARMTCGTEA